MLRGVRQKMKASARTRVVQVVREGDEDERLLLQGSSSTVTEESEKEKKPKENTPVVEKR
jgi:hypothetical protein